MTPDERIVARQRERIEELEEEVRQLRELQKPKRIFPVEWKLQPGQQRLLSAMFDAPYVETNRALHLITNDVDGADVNTVRVRISTMRKILEPMGITILTRWGMGYELIAPSKAIIKSALEQRSAA